MPRRPRPFPLSRLLVIVCSSLQIVLALLDAVARTRYSGFSPAQWIYPGLMIGCGVAGLLAQAPKANALYRPLVVVLNILLIGLTACGVLALFSILKFDRVTQPFILLLFSLIAILPGWVNMIAISMLPHSHSEGPLY